MKPSRRPVLFEGKSSVSLVDFFGNMRAQFGKTWEKSERLIDSRNESP